MRNPKHNTLPFSIIIIVLLALPLFAQDIKPAKDWQHAFAKMPLNRDVPILNETNVVPVLLSAFKRNDAVKAIIFMPGATDEFYFFHRARALLTNTSPTLLDAIVALTNQSLIHATVRSPFLLLHTDEDPLEPISVVEDPKTAERIKKGKFIDHVLYDDRDWDYLHPTLTFRLNTVFQPGTHDRNTCHFFRHSFAAYDLTGWEALQAICMAGKTKFTVKKKKVVFEADSRFMARPSPPPNCLLRE